MVMKKDSSIIECTTAVDNRAMDHRLRALFATGMDADSFHTAAPFWMQERSVDAPDRSTYIETETNVYPNQGIVTIADRTDRLNIYNKGLYEVEVTDDKYRTVALTLFRSFRRETGVAEPSLMGRLFRELSFEFALDFKPAEENPAEAMVRGTDWRVGIRSKCYSYDPKQGGGNPKPSESRGLLEVSGGGLVLSSFRCSSDWGHVLRLFNPSETAAEGTVIFYRDIASCTRLSLEEKAIAEVPVSGSRIQVRAGAGEIMTYGVELAPPTSATQ